MYWIGKSRIQLFYYNYLSLSKTSIIPSYFPCAKLWFTSQQALGDFAWRPWSSRGGSCVPGGILGLCPPGRQQAFRGQSRVGVLPGLKGGESSGCHRGHHGPAGAGWEEILSSFFISRRFVVFGVDMPLRLPGRCTDEWNLGADC